MPPVSVLVVDDPADGLLELLAGQGFEVRTATDGPAALVAAASDPPDAVVTALPVPGMTRWEFFRRLRAETFRAPLAGTISTPGRAGDAARSTAAGAHLHLEHAVDARLLVAVLRRLR